jgi:hypothetical protein
MLCLFVDSAIDAAGPGESGAYSSSAIVHRLDDGDDDDQCKAGFFDINYFCFS